MCDEDAIWLANEEGINGVACNGMIPETSKDWNVLEAIVLH